MNRRNIFLLTLIVLALSAVLVALKNGRESKQVRRIRLSLASAAVAPTRVELMRREAPPIVFEKDPEWRIVSPFAGRADRPRLLKMLDALTTQPIERALSETDMQGLGRSLADFELESPPVRIVLSSPLGTNAVVSLGRVVPGSNGVYAAVGGDPFVYTVATDVLAAVDHPADAFRRRSLFALSAESVAAVDIRRPGGDLRLRKESDGWSLGAERASERNVRALLDALTTSAASGFVWPTGAANEENSASAALLAGYGLEPDKAVSLTIKSADGSAEGRLSLGKEAGNGSVYALAQNGSAIVTVDAALKDLALSGAEFYTDSRVFPVDSRTVSSFTLSTPAVVCTVARTAEGWRLDSPVVAPAEAKTAEGILAKILALSFRDQRDAGLAVSVGTNLQSVVVSPEAVLGDLRLEELRAREILDIAPEAVRRVVAQKGKAGEEATSIVYGSERRIWNVESSKARGAVDEENVKRILAALHPLRATRIVRLKVTAEELARFGLDAPSRTLAIDQSRENAVRRNILIGKETKDGFFATVGSSDAVFILPGETVEELFLPLVSD